MKKKQKIELGNDLAKQLGSAEGVIITAYKGLTFPQISKVRKSVKDSGNFFRVIKNTILKKSLNSSGINSLDNYLVDSTALVIVEKDFAATAKEIKNHAKDMPNLQIKAGIMGGEFLNGTDVLKIADLPSREQLLAQVLATMNAPVQNYVSVLANIPRSLLNVLSAIKEQKN